MRIKLQVARVGARIIINADQCTGIWNTNILVTKCLIRTVGTTFVRDIIMVSTRIWIQRSVIRAYCAKTIVFFTAAAAFRFDGAVITMHTLSYWLRGFGTMWIHKIYCVVHPSPSTYCVAMLIYDVIICYARLERTSPPLPECVRLLNRKKTMDIWFCESYGVQPKIDLYSRNNSFSNLNFQLFNQKNKRTLSVIQQCNLFFFMKTRTTNIFGVSIWYSYAPREAPRVNAKLTEFIHEPETHVGHIFSADVLGTLRR